MKSILILFFGVSAGPLFAELPVDRQMRKLWEDGIKSQMKPGATEFIKAVQNRKHTWVQSKIEKGVDPNEMFYGDYSISKIVFPIHLAIMNGDIKMFDILGPSSNYDCATINYVIGQGVDKTRDCRDILYTLLFAALGDKAGMRLLSHALENYPRIRQGLDSPGLGFALPNLTVRQNWATLAESSCDNAASKEERKRCAEYRAILDLITKYQAEERQAPNSPEDSNQQR